MRAGSLRFVACARLGVPRSCPAVRGCGEVSETRREAQQRAGWAFLAGRGPLSVVMLVSYRPLAQTGLAWRQRVRDAIGGEQEVFGRYFLHGRISPSFGLDLRQPRNFTAYAGRVWSHRDYYCRTSQPFDRTTHMWQNLAAERLISRASWRQGNRVQAAGARACRRRGLPRCCRALLQLLEPPARLERCAEGL